MYSELVSEFNEQPVVDFETAASWQGPEVAYRVRVDYEDDASLARRLDALVASPGAEDVAGLLIGCWAACGEGDNAAPVVAKLVELAPRLPNLKGLFLGDITFEECEISWINQTDVSPLLTAFPKLEWLSVRGGNGLAFSRVRHEALRVLIVETGGLPRSALRDIFLCDFPDLRFLELQLGDESYGFDGSVEDLQPLLSGDLFPRLTYLGLTNSVIADDIAAVVVNSPLVQRIQMLDLSLGNLSDEGVRSLHALSSCKNLQELDITHHYASPETVAELTAALPCEVRADAQQDVEDDWRPIVHAE